MQRHEMLNGEEGSCYTLSTSTFMALFTIMFP